MKISLNLGGTTDDASKEAEGRALDRLIQGAKRGDWEAKEVLCQKFKPLIASLAAKRSGDPAVQNKYVEAARMGLLAAAEKYTPAIGPEKFRLFALDYMESSMDRVGRGGGFLSRLFGR